MTITEIIQAFEIFFNSLHNRSFVKSLKLNKMGERQLLPLLRLFLLGYFGEKCSPEERCKLLSKKSRYGYVDFIIGNIAVEFAVRKHDCTRASVSPKTNKTEVEKLLRHDGKSLLVLFDLSKDTFDESKLEEFRIFSLGRGNHRITPFSIAYFYIEKTKPIQCNCVRKLIRVV